jgi:DNA-binding transcriptional LysR family regulator
MLDRDARGRATVSDPDAVPHDAIAQDLHQRSRPCGSRVSAGCSKHPTVEISEVVDIEALRDLGLGAVDIVVTQEYDLDSFERIDRLTFTPLVSDRRTLIPPPEMPASTTIEELGDAPWLLIGRTTRCALATKRILRRRRNRTAHRLHHIATMLVLSSPATASRWFSTRVLDDDQHKLRPGTSRCW